MAGSSNFQQWNPSAANQETDAAYTADSQRIGGAINGQIFNDQLANKLFYQASTFIAAFAQMLANKGYVVSDASLSTLIGVLANVLTAADIRPNIQPVSFATTLNINAATSNGFQCTLSGNTTINISGVSPGQEITFLLVQDTTGGRTVTWGTGVGKGPSVNPSPAGISCVTFFADIYAVLWPKVGGAVST